MELVCEQVTGLLLFLLVIPILWNRIDREANQTAKREAERQRSDRKLDNENDDDDDDTTNNDNSTNDNNDIDDGILSLPSPSSSPPVLPLKKDDNDVYDDDDDFEYDKNLIRTDGESATSDVSCPVLEDDVNDHHRHRHDDDNVVMKYPPSNKKDD